jgi:hypothetical protein
VKAFRAELLLARTFFARFFESDLVPSGVAQVQLVIWSIALLAAPGFMLAFQLEKKYARLWRARRSALPDAILADQVLFITYGMLALGLVALVIWEGVFPDRRDARVLGVLPLRVRTHVVGRLSALGALAGLFAVGANSLSAVSYGATIWSYGFAGNLVRGIAAHLAATALAGLFVFFLLIALQGALLNLFGRRAAQRLSLVAQTLFVMAVLQAMLFAPPVGNLVSAAFRSGEPSWTAWLPPAWFVSLYSVLAGADRPVPEGYALRAAAATAIMFAIAAALLAGSYRRLVRMALETADTAPRRGSSLRARLSALLARVAVSRPVERAIAGFTLRTIARNRTHLMLLAIYVGAAAALAVTAFVPLVARRGIGAFHTPSVALLSVPLVLYFFILCGLRAVFGIPVEIKANWIFRLHAPDEEMGAAVAGVRAALLLAVVLPVAAAAGAAGTMLWGLRIGSMHAIFTGALGVLLMDVLLAGMRKVPFACTYYPGRARARTLWPFYLAAFTIYAYSLAALELASFANLRLFAASLGVIALLVAVLAYLRQRLLHPPPGLTYEEQDPDSIFEGFRLSEGLAAESVRRR